MESRYEVFACRFATVPPRPAHKVFYKYEVYRDDPREFDLSLYFWLVRSEHRTVLVDCGWNHDRAAERGYSVGSDPLDLLREFGVDPAAVDHVVISHMHFDHVGNLSAFPRATFSLGRAEFDFWTGPFGDRAVVAQYVDPGDVAELVALEAAGRVDLVDGESEIFPGISVLPVGGHTPGQLITSAAWRDGTIVLASDAIHLHEELERDRPYLDFCNIGDVYAGYEKLRELAADPRNTIVAGHDPLDAANYREASPSWFDLTAPKVPHAR